MNQFGSLWLEFWESERPNRDNIPMVTLRASDPCDESDGLQTVWFVFTFEEWQSLLAGKRASFSDGYHKLDAMFDNWTFYDFELPPPPAGTAEIRYRRVNVPKRVLEILMLTTGIAFRKYHYTEPGKHGLREKVTVNLSPFVGLWSRVYGQGKGQVQVSCDDETRKRLDECLKNDSFKEMYERVKNFARNTTHSVWEEGVLLISKDLDGFFWQAGGLVGGLINHGTEDEPSWSIHT